MFLYPSAPLFIVAQMLSVFMALSANSWFMAWLALEINLISFLPLLMKKTKYSSESALKYFLTQAMASVTIILAATWMQIHSPLMTSLIIMSLLMKSGSAPFHQWLPSLIESLPWPSLFNLLTLQKMAPLGLLSLAPFSNPYLIIFYLHIQMSAFVGAVGGLSQTSLRKIMVYSSISHMAWLLSSLILANWMWLFYFSIYTLILATLIYTLADLNLSSINQILSATAPAPASLLVVSTMSLGGLPPFTGFVPKLIITLELLNQTSLFLLLPLLISTFISLFYYARLFLSNLFLAHTNNMNWYTTNPAYLTIMTINLGSVLYLPLLL